MRTSEQIKAEIESRFGFFPPFFAPALDSPRVLENLWRQTVSAYLENPLSPLFKEKLNALLSRYCTVPYCIVCHSSALRPLGLSAGQVLALLESPLPAPDGEKALFGQLPVPDPEEAAAPAPDSPLEQTLLDCATRIFLDRHESEAAHAELRRLLGADLYPHLIAYLAYIKTCHTWMEAHPDISYEADRRVQDSLGPLLAEEPALADFFAHYQERIKQRRLDQAVEGARADERRQANAALRESEGRFRQMADAIPHIAWTTDTAGAVEYYNQRWHDYSGLDFEQTRNWGWEAMVHPDDLERAGGVWRNALASGSVSEVEYRLRRADGEYRWHLGRSVPVRDEAGRIRRWVGTATDIEQRRQIEDERERLLATARARAEREILLNQIGEAIRASNDPDTIQARSAAALGEALNADRCFFLAYDAAGGRIIVNQEWRRGGLTPLAGSYRQSAFQPLLDPLQAGQTVVVEDARTDQRFPALVSTMERLGLRAAIRVPLFDQKKLVSLVGVAMADTPRIWTLDEIILVETVAAQTRTAAEAARLRQREHNIATHLQEALQPPLSTAVPGLALQRHYQVALEEAEVGGDFFDVFPIAKNCTALVVGDLSGKGLAAAAQVSVVRNMLRATLYLEHALMEAVTNLNNIIAENDLLAGFATLFVGVYDSDAGTLAYVNCGQEPGLVRRAHSGRVEELLPTGPILGTFAGARFTERTISLASGDALALFTDGVTEAGPNHADMLGVEGVAAILAAPLKEENADAEPQAEELLLRLIAEVDQYAQAGVRDDVCLLIAVVTG